MRVLEPSAGENAFVVSITATHLLPVTRARVLAALRRDVEAFAVLAALAPCRRDALLRVAPDYPASRVWASRDAAPYG